MHHLQRHFTVPEVAEIFGVTSATIRLWIKDGKIKAVKIGGGHYWRVPESAIKDLSESMYGDQNADHAKR